MFGGSAQGSINNSLPIQTRPVEKIIQLKQLGKYIQFSYPSNYRSLPTQKPQGTNLESFDLITKNAPFNELALAVSSLPSGSLADDGSYNLRSKDTATYKSESWLVNGQNIPVFADLSQTYSKTAFVTHNGMLATITLTGSGPGLQQTQMATLKSLEWLR